MRLCLLVVLGLLVAASAQSQSAIDDSSFGEKWIKEYGWTLRTFRLYLAEDATQFWVLKPGQGLQLEQGRAEFQADLLSVLSNYYQMYPSRIFFTSSQEPEQSPQRVPSTGQRDVRLYIEVQIQVPNDPPIQGQTFTKDILRDTGFLLGDGTDTWFASKWNIGLTACDPLDPDYAFTNPFPNKPGQYPLCNRVVEFIPLASPPPAATATLILTSPAGFNRRMLLDTTTVDKLYMLTGLIENSIATMMMLQDSKGLLVPGCISCFGVIQVKVTDVEGVPPAGSNQIRVTVHIFVQFGTPAQAQSGVGDYITENGRRNLALVFTADFIVKFRFTIPQGTLSGGTSFILTSTKGFVPYDSHSNDGENDDNNGNNGDHGFNNGHFQRKLLDNSTMLMYPTLINRVQHSMSEQLQKLDDAGLLLPGCQSCFGDITITVIDLNSVPQSSNHQLNFTVTVYTQYYSQNATYITDAIQRFVAEDPTMIFTYGFIVSLGIIPTIPVPDFVTGFILQSSEPFQPAHRRELLDAWTWKVYPKLRADISASMSTRLMEQDAAGLLINASVPVYNHFGTIQTIVIDIAEAPAFNAYQLEVMVGIYSSAVNNTGNSTDEQQLMDFINHWMSTDPSMVFTSDFITKWNIVPTANIQPAAQIQMTVQSSHTFFPDQQNSTMRRALLDDGGDNSDASGGLAAALVDSMVKKMFQLDAAGQLIPSCQNCFGGFKLILNSLQPWPSSNGTQIQVAFSLWVLQRPGDAQKYIADPIMANMANNHSDPTKVFTQDFIDAWFIVPTGDLTPDVTCMFVLSATATYTQGRRRSLQSSSVLNVYPTLKQQLEAAMSDRLTGVDAQGLLMGNATNPMVGYFGNVTIQVLDIETVTYSSGPPPYQLQVTVAIWTTQHGEDKWNISYYIPSYVQTNVDMVFSGSFITQWSIVNT